MNNDTRNSLRIDLKNKIAAKIANLNTLHPNRCGECDGFGVVHDDHTVLPCSCLSKGLNPLDTTQTLEGEATDWETPSWLFQMFKEINQLYSDIHDLEYEDVSDLEDEVEGF